MFDEIPKQENKRMKTFEVRGELINTYPNLILEASFEDALIENLGIQ